MKNSIKYSIRRKLHLLAVWVAVPFLVMIVYLLVSMGNYSRTYDTLADNLTIANNYNLNFKEEMDESLYKLVVGYVTFDTIGEDESLRDPYVLIAQLRSEFTKLMDITTESESRLWLESLLRNIDTLEKRVDDIKESLETGGRYHENIEMLDNNIYILTELIQDDIQYYIYYQTKSIGKVTNSLHQQVNEFIVICSICVAALVLGVSVVAIGIVKGILKPIRQLYDAMEKMAEGDFSVRAQVKTKDEISLLADGFNNMAENMQSLIGKMKEDEQKLRRMDLRLLQEQINPHFLYNTLDTIVWLIEGNEPEQAVEMVVTLSDFFRLVLSKGKELITIKEEELHIKSYLEIQQRRYQDILEYEISIDRVLYDYQILKLTLQPIVENALYHGIKYKRAKGYIHIHGEKDGGIIRLTVRDNGAGMEESELLELRKEIERPCKETEKGFGLANVNERIHMYFGAEYGMKIASQKGKGTTVEIIIPAIRTEKQKEPANG